MKRVQLSGAQKRKAAEEKNRKKNELLSKIPRITSFCSSVGSRSSSSFGVSPSPTIDEQREENDSIVVPSPAIDTNEQSSSTASLFSSDGQREENDSIAVPSPTFDTNEQCDDGQSEIQSVLSDELLPCSADAALWDMEENLNFLQSFWSKKGLFIVFLFAIFLFCDVIYSIRFFLFAFQAPKSAKTFM